MSKATKKRYQDAVDYLEREGVEIDSITEIHTIEAIKIASGYDPNKDDN